KAWPVRSAQCRPPSPPPPASPPASKAAPRRADRRPSPSAGSPARPRNTTEKPSSPSPPRQPRPLPSSTHPPPESEDHDRFSSSSICHANFQSIALLVVGTRLDAKLNLHVFNRLLRLPLDYFERHPAGETMHRMTAVYK